MSAIIFSLREPFVPFRVISGVLAGFCLVAFGCTPSVSSPSTPGATLDDPAPPEPGLPLPPWAPGTLDIHHINTGMGSATFFVFPDGTTMLVDAGSEGSRPGVTPPRPDASRTSGAWIARYITRMFPEGRPPVLDYALITHFHADHMGDVVPSSPASPNGPYKLTGMTEVGESIPIRKMIDRGWPDYALPSPPKDGLRVQNYRAFLDGHVRRQGMRVERFRPGRRDQIVLVHRPADYPTFEVRNIAANGEVWTGRGEETASQFPPLESLAPGDRPHENMLSIVFRLRYGRFDTYSGGDLPGVPPRNKPSWHDVETPVARAVGPVDVLLLDHHGCSDTSNAFFVGTLRPRVYVVHLWGANQLALPVMERLFSEELYPGLRDLFSTNLMDANRQALGPLVERIKSVQGHIVVRVAPGGDRYWVVILDDGSESRNVLAVHGPYTAH